MVNNTEKYIGKYRIIEEIGRGKYSVVYRAENSLLLREVAIKQLNSDLFSSPESIELFINDIKPIVSISDNHFIPIYDIISDNFTPSLVLEYMKSGDLHDYVKNNPGLSSSQKSSLLQIIANSIDALHHQGFIHGDLKPGNILFDENRKLKISDIGILKAIEKSSGDNLENIKPTPEYTSPELAEGGIANTFSDQYSLAIIAFELLCGKLPFTGETSLAVLIKQIRNPPPIINDINPLLPTSINVIMQRALAKNPGERYPDCSTFISLITAEISNYEKDQVEKLLPVINNALSKNDFQTAQPIIEKVLKLSTDSTVNQNLQNTIEIFQKANVFYLSAASSLNTSKIKLFSFKKKYPNYPDIHSIFNKISPPPLPLIPQLWEKFKRSFYTTLILFFAGIFLSLSAVGFTNYSAFGASQKATLIAYSRTSTPLPPTITPTITLTPTITSTLTLTPTQTAIPTYVLGSIVKRNKDGMEMVFVPGSAFIMGSKEGQEDEQPVQNLFIPDFWIDKTEVTNYMYSKCVLDGACNNPFSESSFTRNSYYSDPQFADFPVINVDWNQARSYCNWVESRLPTEAEWEKAARGTDGRTYPMGEDIDPLLANYFGGLGDTAKVGSYPLGKSPYGAYDMAGNVWEWVSSEYKPYPYDAKDGREEVTGSNARVLRGGSWYYHFDLARTSYRYWDSPNRTNFDIGFRCSRSAK